MLVMLVFIVLFFLVIAVMSGLSDKQEQLGVLGEDSCHFGRRELLVIRSGPGCEKKETWSIYMAEE